MRYFKFLLSNGDLRFLTIEEALKLNDPLVPARLREIRKNLDNRRTVKDGFEPGWQPNINAYAGGRKEYEKILKDQGLVEIGYDKIPEDSTKTSNYFENDFMIQECFNQGIDLTGNEVYALKSGEYFENNSDE